MIVTLQDMKNYLRVDFGDDDALLQNLITSAEEHCMDILRIDDEMDFEESYNAKIAVLYMVAYLYEHRDNADYNKLNLTLRALLFGDREAKF